MEDEERRAKLVALAKDEYFVEGEVEVDDNALLSEGDDNGCFVAAWVWVPFTNTEFDKDKEN